LVYQQKHLMYQPVYQTLSVPKYTKCTKLNKNDAQCTEQTLILSLVYQYAKLVYPT